MLTLQPVPWFGARVLPVPQGLWVPCGYAQCQSLPNNPEPVLTVHCKTDAGELGHGVAPCEMQHRVHWEQKNLSTVQVRGSKSEGRKSSTRRHMSVAVSWHVGLQPYISVKKLVGLLIQEGSLGLCFGSLSLQTCLMTSSVALLYAGLCVLRPLWLPALQCSLLCSYQKQPPAQSCCQGGHCRSTVNLVAAGERLETQVRMGWGSARNVCTDPHLLFDDTALFSSPAAPEHAESRISVLQTTVSWERALRKLIWRCWHLLLNTFSSLQI